MVVITLPDGRTVDFVVRRRAAEGRHLRLCEEERRRRGGRRHVFPVDA
jgi:hypothetical protein